MGGTLLHDINRRLVHTQGPSRQLRCHAIVQHTAVTNAATRGMLHVSVHTLHAAIFFSELVFRDLQFGYPVSVW